MQSKQTNKLVSFVLIVFAFVIACFGVSYHNHLCPSRTYQVARTTQMSVVSPIHVTTRSGRHFVLHVGPINDGVVKHNQTMGKSHAKLIVKPRAFGGAKKELIVYNHKSPMVKKY